MILVVSVLLLLLLAYTQGGHLESLREGGRVAVQVSSTETAFGWLVRFTTSPEELAAARKQPEPGASERPLLIFPFVCIFAQL